MSDWGRTLGRVVSALLALTAAFALGVATGVVGTRQQPSGVLDQAAADIASHAATPVDEQRLERAAVQGMLSTLDDRWSSYYTPSQFRTFQQSLAGRYSGIGVWLRPGATTAQSVTLASVAPGSPAAAAGLHPGDELVTVDGHATTGATVGDVVAWLRGKDGTAVSLTVQQGGDLRTITVHRASLTVPDVVIDRLPGQVTAIRIHAFTRGVGREVRDALSTDRSAYAQGIILDLRGNPGGLLDEAVEVASAFLDGGTVVSYEQRGQPLRRLQATPGGDTTTPLAVLVDHSSASAAEVVAAALQERGRAVIVGQRTHGKGSVQQPIRLPDGSALEITVGRYITPDGSMIDGNGIEPDILVPRTAAPDVTQARALEVLKGLMAASQPLNSAG